MMIRPSNKNRASVTIVLADNDSYMRQGLRNALASEGYRDVRTVGRVSLVRDVILTTMADLLILDVNTPDGDAVALVSEIRRGKLGKNPFISIILATWDTDPAAVSRAVNSGADLILMKPFSPAQLFAKIEGLVFDRKPYVSTAGYIGPDRRQAGRGGDARKYEVPNTLKEKLEGRTADPVALAEQIDRTVRDMKDGRLEYAAITLASMVEKLCATYEGQAGLDNIDEMLSTIIRIATEIRATSNGEVNGPCASIIKIVQTIQADPAGTEPKEIELLRPLPRELRLAVTPALVGL